MFNGNGFGLDIGALLGNMMAGNRNNDGFGDGNGWWVLIILLALFGGFGNGGLYGNGSGGGTTVISGDLQRGFDTQSIISKLDGINNGLCSLGYDQLAQMNGINANVMQTGFGLQNAIQAVATQLSGCCCDMQRAIDGVNYNLATDTCAITTAITQAAQNIMNNDNANYRQLHDENVALQMEAKNQQIAALQTQLNQCWYRENNAEQTNQIVSAILPPPRPSYQVPNPYTGMWGYSNGNGNCGNSCCNNNGWGF